MEPPKGNIEFDEATIARIEEKLEQDVAEHKKKVRIWIIVCAIILMIIFRGTIAYWIKFSIAIPKDYDVRPINVKDEPVQTDYTEEEKAAKTFTYHSLINENRMTVIPQAHYVLSGMVTAYNHDFLFISKFFDSAALYDLGVAWGELADKKTFTKYFKTYSAKNEMWGSRVLWTEYKRSTYASCPYNSAYLRSHVSHTHIVPANRNVMAALLKIREYDKVVVEGELIDMISVDGVRYQTSTTRTDSSDGNRGNGNCETLYATKVRIGNKIYK